MAKGQLGTRDLPTMVNAGWQALRSRNGRAKGLYRQARQPFLYMIEMTMPAEHTARRLPTGLDQNQVSSPPTGLSCSRGAWGTADTISRLAVGGHPGRNPTGRSRIAALGWI